MPVPETPTEVADLPTPEDVAALPLPVSLVVVAVAASLAVVGWMAARCRAGLPIVPERPHEPVPWNGVDVLQVLLINVAVTVAGAAGMSTESPLAARLAINCLAMAVGTAFSLAYLLARGGSLVDVGIGAPRPAADVRLALGSLALVVAPVLGLAWLVNLFVPYRHPLVDLLLAQQDSTALALAGVSAVVAAPIAEELFFRRVLQGWLEKRLTGDGGERAVALAAAAFALAHFGQGLAFLPLYPLALVLGHLVRRTGSILPSILLHACFNAVSIGLLLLQAPGTEPAGG